MSIKGSSKNIKIELVFPVFFVFTILAIALRTYQCLNIIEADTGFYKAEDFSVICLYAVLALASVAIFVIGYLAKKVPQSVMPEGKNIPLAIAGLVMVVLMLAYGPINFIQSIKNGSELIVSHSGYRSPSQLTFLIKSGFFFSLFEVVFGIVSLVYFIMFTSKYFGASINLQKRKILAVMPVFWQTSRMIQRFTRTISIINVSDLLLELFAIAFMMMFFLFFAQLASNVNSRHVVNKVISYGLIGAMFSLVTTIPRIIAYAVDSSTLVKTELLEVCDIGFAVFVIALCFALKKMPKEDHITLKEVEKLRKAHDQEIEENEE